MRPLSVDKLNIVFSKLHSGQTTCQILSSTCVSIGTISKIHSEHFSDLPKSSGGCPVKLSLTNIHHAVNLITSGKAETAEWVSKALQFITNQPVTPQTVHRHLRKTGMKAKKKKPLLSQKHRKERIVMATLECCGDHTITQAERGENQSMNKSTRHTIEGISPGRGENQREKAKVSHCQQAHIILHLTTIRAITWCTLTLHYVDL